MHHLCSRYSAQLAQYHNTSVFAEQNKACDISGTVSSSSRQTNLTIFRQQKPWIWAASILILFAAKLLPCQLSKMLGNMPTVRRSITFFWNITQGLAVSCLIYCNMFKQKKSSCEISKLKWSLSPFVRAQFDEVCGWILCVCSNVQSTGVSLLVHLFNQGFCNELLFFSTSGSLFLNWQLINSTIGSWLNRKIRLNLMCSLGTCFN